MPIDLSQFAKPADAIPSAPTDAVSPPSDLNLAQFAQADVPTVGGLNDSRGGTVAKGLGEELGRGVSRGVNQLQSSFYGLSSIIAESFDSDPIREFASEGLDAVHDSDFINAASVQGLDSIENGGDFFRWATGVLGEQIPVLATVFAGGGVGGAIAKRAASSSLRNGVRAAASAHMRNTGVQASEREIAATITRMLNDPVQNKIMHQAMIKGATRGAVVPAFGLEAGGIQNELIEANISAPGTALLGGAAAAALEVLPVANLIGRMFPGMDDVLAKSFIRGVAETMGMQAVLEGSTEGAQEMVAIAARAFHDPSFDISTPANRMRILESVAAGALVGGVTGGIGQAASSTGRKAREGGIEIMDGTRRMRDFVADQVRPLTGSTAETRERAATLVPGMEEVRRNASDFIVNTVAPILGSARAAAAAGLASVRAAAGSGIDVAGLRRQVDQADEFIRARVAPEFALLNERVDAAITTINDKAAALTGVARASFVAQQMKELKDDIAKWAEERIRPAVEQSESDLENRIRTADYGDEDQLFEEGIFPRDLGRATFGMFATVLGARGGTVVSSRVRTRDDDAVPFTSREGANNAATQLRASMPELSKDAFVVIEAEGGFVVSIEDIGAAEAVFEQLRFLDGIVEAQEGSQANPDPQRRIRVKKPGNSKFTRMDLPTLVLVGQDLIEKAGGTLSPNAAKAAVQGLDTMIARLLAQKYKIEGGLPNLRKKVLFGVGDGTITVERGRAQAQFAVPVVDLAEQVAIATEAVERATATLDGDLSLDARDRAGDTLVEAEARLEEAQRNFDESQERGPRFDAGEIDQEIPTRQENVTETEAGLNASSKKAANKQSREAHARKWWQVRPPVHASLSNVSNQFAKDVMDLAEELLTIAGVRTRLRIVDAEAAATLLDKDHPLHAALERAVAEDQTGRILTYGGDAIIYLSDRVLVGSNEQQARLNTFAVLSHEMGHLVEFTYYNRLSDELKDRLKTAHEQDGSTKTFEEWMADQFVGWAATNREARTAVERFFQNVVDTMRRIFGMLTARYGVTETFNEFMKGVTNTITDERSLNDFARHFLNEGVTGYAWFGLPQSRDFDLPDMRLPPNVKEQLLDKLNEYPVIRQAAFKTWDMMLALHQQFTQTLTGRLRGIGTSGSSALADLLNRTPGREADNATYPNMVQLMQSVFATSFNEILDTMTEAEKLLAMDQMIKFEGGLDLAPGKAGELQAVFASMYQYLRDSGLEIEEIRNYVPRVWDVELVRNNDVRIRELLLEKGVKNENIEPMLDWMAAAGNEASFQENFSDSLVDLPYEGFLQQRNIVLNDPVFEEFRSRDLDRIVERYLSSAVKRAEFNRFFGQDVRTVEPGGEFNQTEKLDQMVADAVEEGATPEQTKFMTDAVDAMLGRYGRKIDPDIRRTMAWVATYQNVRLLLFSTLASLPDVVGPAIRANDVGLAFRAFRNNMSAIITPADNNQLNDMARVWGIISDSMNQHILTEHFDSHWFPERAKNINEKFFRAIGLERWTNMTRAAALAVGIDFMKVNAEKANNGDEKGAANLAELGLTAEQVNLWMEGGEKAFGAGGYITAEEGGQSEANQKVAQAMIQFVNESIMKPNPSQRPLWASNPALMLIFHLKSFIYSFHDTITRQVIRNMQVANTPWQKAYALAAPGLMLLAFTGLGLELRELLQYKMWGRAGRTDRMSGPDYMLELITRSGITGPAQMAFDFEGAHNRGQNAFIAIAGPTIGQVNDLVAKPFSQTVPRAIPGVSQIPELRQLVRDFTPL